MPMAGAAEKAALTHRGISGFRRRWRSFGVATLDSGDGLFIPRRRYSCVVDEQTLRILVRVVSHTSSKGCRTRETYPETSLPETSLVVNYRPQNIQAILFDM